MTVSVGDERSAAERRRFRGLPGLRNLAPSPTVKATEAEVFGRVVEAAAIPVGEAGVSAVIVDSAIYGAIWAESSI